MEKPVLIKELKRRDKGGKKYGLFRCRCGNEWEAIIYNVNSGNTTNCGCVRKIKVGQINKKHGMANQCSEYTIWKDIHKRCNNINYKQYHDYGGRGIKVCQLWEYSFEDFLKDIGPRPSKKHSVHRIDNDGDYCPNNCRWATQKEQCRSKRDNVMITYNGVTKCISEWAEFLGFDQRTLHARLQKYSPEIAFNRPLQKQQRK